MSGAPPKERSSKPVLPGTTWAALAGVSVTLCAPAGAGGGLVRSIFFDGPGPPLLALSRISGRRPWARSGEQRRGCWVR